MPSRSINYKTERKIKSSNITQNFTQFSILQKDYLHYKVACIHEECIIFSYTSTLINTEHHECPGKAPPDHNAVPGGGLKLKVKTCRNIQCEAAIFHMQPQKS